MNTKERIIELLVGVNRAGMESLIAYLSRDGFFESPASKRFHGNHPGGLAEHSLNVFELLDEFAREPRFEFGEARYPGQRPLPVARENVIVATLLHDVCKMGAYTGQEGSYAWSRLQPKGHALLSLIRISKYIKLTEIEEMMIRFHMGIYGLFEFQDGTLEYSLRGDHTKSKEERYGKSLVNAWYHNPIVKVMYFCDELATLRE